MGDLHWQAADAGATGFLLGATAGRTTLLGEGLQNQDGHSLVLASTVPACEAYDPAFAYELGAIVKHGVHRMYGPQATADDDVFFYITVYNENYEMPPRPDHVTDDAVVSGLYHWAAAPAEHPVRATVVFSGSAHTAARQAQTVLSEQYGVAVDLWSATSYKRLRTEALEVERWNRLHPGETPRRNSVEIKLAGGGPVVAVRDFMRMVPEQSARFVPRPFVAVGTDGFGRSDTREALRRFFEIDTGHVVVTVLAALAAEGAVGPEVVARAIESQGIDPAEPDQAAPTTLSAPGVLPAPWQPPG